MPDMKTLTINGVQYELPFAPDELFSTKIYPKTYAAFMEELKSIYTNIPNTQNTPKKFVYAGIETGGDVASGELGGGVWFVEINRGSENYGTIKASNEYYGDRRLDIYGTWGKWVDVSPKAFTPASHATDKNNPHGVTPAQIGAAPAGYGLGENSGRQPYTADLNEITTIGFWAMPGGNAVNYPDKISYSGYGSLLVERRTDKITQTVKFNGYIAVRSSSDNGVSWEDWKYVNPPMNSGVEYRTTERCNGSVVYAKRVAYSVGDINADSAAVDTLIPHGISNFSYLVRSHCAKDSYVLPYLKDNGGFTAIVGVNSSNITLRAFKASWAASTWHVDLYYVKS